MPDCARCGERLRRAHRTKLEKSMFSAAYTCTRCHRRTRVPYRTVQTKLDFLLSRYTHCIRCGDSDVRRQRKGDRSDGASVHPLSRLARATGAPAYECVKCGARYHDWRPSNPKTRHPKKPRVDPPRSKSDGSEPPPLVGLS